MSWTWSLEWGEEGWDCRCCCQLFSALGEEVFSSQSGTGLAWGAVSAGRARAHHCWDWTATGELSISSKQSQTVFPDSMYCSTDRRLCLSEACILSIFLNKIILNEWCIYHLKTEISGSKLGAQFLLTFLFWRRGLQVSWNHTLSAPTSSNTAIYSTSTVSQIRPFLSCKK